MIFSCYCVCFGYLIIILFKFVVLTICREKHMQSSTEIEHIINKKKQIFVLSKLISSRNMVII